MLVSHGLRGKPPSGLGLCGHGHGHSLGLCGDPGGLDLGLCLRAILSASALAFVAILAANTFVQRVRSFIGA